jgi:Na+/melibiose symporter-like transporter
MADESRQDRELIEFLNELRVAMPGVQVLFAFLLTLPFTQRFAELGDLERDTYTFALVTAALASVLLIAPSAQHRLRWRQHDKERLLRIGNVLAVAGTVLLACSMASAVWVIVRFVHGSTWAPLLAGALVAVTVVLWYVVPLVLEFSERGGK